MPPFPENSVPISVSHQPQFFQLIALPPPLLEVLTSKNPPTLHLKSPHSTSSSATDSALLCTPSQTFEIKEIQTSNLLYVLEPSQELSLQGKKRKRDAGQGGEVEEAGNVVEGRDSDNEDESSDDELPIKSKGLIRHIRGGQGDAGDTHTAGLRAIATCRATLEPELIPSARCLIAAREYLNTQLPTCGEYIDPSELRSQATTTDRTFAALLLNAPCSEAELRAAWIELCIYEYRHEDVSSGKELNAVYVSNVIPDAESLLNAWNALLSAMSRDGELRDGWETSMESGNTIGRIKAILEKIGYIKINDGTKRVNRTESVRLAVGLEWLLKDNREFGRSLEERRSVDIMVERCRNSVPESWRTDITWESLKRVLGEEFERVGMHAMD